MISLSVEINKVVVERKLLVSNEMKINFLVSLCVSTLTA